ncbi:MAG: hypothetical protein N2B05_03910, partial [Gemmatimonadales bacterium]
GRLSEAIPVLSGLSAPWAGSGPLATLALARLAAADTVEAAVLLSRITELGDPFAAGLVLAAMGDEEAAFEAFQRTDHWADWPTLAVHHLYPTIWETLSGDPRYDELVGDVARAWGLAPGGDR